MAIIVHLLLTLGFGAAGLIFMGGFWGAVFGLVFGLLEAAILCCYQGEDGNSGIWGDVEDSFDVPVLIGFPTLLCGILLGKIVGGFGWVMLGLLIGALFGSIVYGIHHVGKLFAALFLLFVPAGTVLGIVFPLLEIRWLSALLGAAAGVPASFILSAPHTFWLKAKRKEYIIMIAEQERQREEMEKVEKKRLEEESERKRLEEEKEKELIEEHERNRPINDKLAELKIEVEAVNKRNSAELKKARQDYSLVYDEYQESPENMYNAFKNIDTRITTNRVTELEEIAKFYDAKFRVSAAKAKLASSIYTANRKKAVLLFERLKDIKSKLTAEQEKRDIKDAAKTLQIGSLSVYIPDTLYNRSQMNANFGAERLESVINIFSSFGDFARTSGFTIGEAGLIYAGVAIFDFLGNWLEHERKKAESLKRSYISLNETIRELYEATLKAEGFFSRVDNINRTLEGSMDAYEKLFVSIYNSLFPPGDDSKSKQAREANKRNGGVYFTDEEADAVLILYKTGLFLLDLVDTKI